MRLEKRSSMINYKSLLIGSLLVFILNAGLFPESEYIVIKNPVPNLKEKNFVQLKKVGEIVDEIAKGVFLFYPVSMAMDLRHNLYVYDSMQAKILVFDPSFKYISSLGGGVGNGPGEFMGTGQGFVVDLSIGLDGKLYAHDERAFIILVFDTEKLKYDRDIKYEPGLESGFSSFFAPVVDKEGNFIMQKYQDGQLIVFNNKGKILLSLPHKEKKREILFIENKMAPPPKGLSAPIEPFYYSPFDLVLNYTSRSELLVYFALSGTLYVVPQKGKAQHFRIWPEMALEDLKKSVKGIDYGYARMFDPVFLDGDNDEFFLLKGGGTKTIRRIYKINLKGELISVFIAPVINNEPPRFMLKKNNYFIAKHSEKILIYKE